MFRPPRSGALGVLLALALGTPAMALPPGVHCGDDYWFQVEPPDGWREDWRAHGEQLGVVFEPPTGSPEAAETRIALTLFPAQGDDPQQTLDRALWLVLFTASPTAIEDEPLRHAHLRSRAVRVTVEGGSLLLIAVAPAGRHHYVLSVARAGSRRPADLAVARRILRSLRVDPERACMPGPDGTPVEVMRADAGSVLPASLAPPGEEHEEEPAPEAPPAARLGEPWRSFPLERATMGCALLERMFVPIACEPAEVDGAPALLVDLRGDGSASGEPSVEAAIDRFAGRVAAPWCWQARGRADAPRLLFATGEEGVLREFPCAEGRFASPRRARARLLRAQPSP